MKTGELAARLAVDESTIRLWSGQYYTAYMSASAKGQGRRRIFTDQDARILAFVADARLRDDTHDEIGAALKALQADGWRGLPDVPPLPETDPDMPIVARETAEIALREQGKRLNLQIAQLQADIERLESALSHERGKRADLEQELLTKTAELGQLRGQLDTVDAERASWGQSRRLLLGVLVAVALTAAVLLAVVLLLALGAGG